MNTSLFFQSDFYRQADELSDALVRVEAVWADRFQPSWMIFIASPSLMWQAVGRSFVDGFAAGVRQAAWLTRVTAEIRMTLYGRRWFRALPRWARHWVVRRLVQTQARPEDATAAPGLSRGAFLALSERIARRTYWTLYDEDDEEE
jgi:hypothetical protein